MAKREVFVPEKREAFDKIVKYKDSKGNDRFGRLSFVRANLFCNSNKKKTKPAEEIRISQCSAPTEPISRSRIFNARDSYSYCQAKSGKILSNLRREAEKFLNDRQLT